MTILFAPDKFKGSLHANQVCAAIDEALREAGVDFNADYLPMADGGEGTSAMLTAAAHGTTIACAVNDPLFRPVQATYGLSADGGTAFIEMASASGLSLLVQAERDPLKTTTYGTGQLMADALQRGVKNIVLGIGGTATNDGGMGVMAALGVKFLAGSGEALRPIGANLKAVDDIDTSGLLPAAQKVNVTALCDVDNPLYGPHGAANTFAPQKGAGADAVAALDNGLHHLAAVIAKRFGIDVNVPGAGAGGGIAATLIPLLGARFEPGFNAIAHHLRLEDRIVASDVVFTGEGKVDEQTFSGKVVKGVADLCRRHGKPFFVLAGISTLSAADVARLGAARVVSLVDADTTSEQAMSQAFALVKRRVKEQIVPLLLSAGSPYL